MSHRAEKFALEISLKAENDKLREENAELTRKLNLEMQLSDQLGKKLDDLIKMFKE